MIGQRITIGIDNGQSGSIGVIAPGRVSYLPVPTIPYLHYGKKGSIGKRLDRHRLRAILHEVVDLNGSAWVGFDNIRVFIERPFSGKFINAVVPAHRFFESTITVMEDFDLEHKQSLGYEVVDSGAWQKSVLGNVSGSDALKLASKLRGVQLYPQLKDTIEAHGDADGLMIAHHYHNLNTRK
jgi:hypothetical protein